MKHGFHGTSRCHWAPQLTLNPRKARVFGAPSLCLGRWGSVFHWGNGETSRFLAFQQAMKQITIFWSLDPHHLFSIFADGWFLSFENWSNSQISNKLLSRCISWPTLGVYQSDSTSFFFFPLFGWDLTPEHGALSPWFYRWWYSLIYSLFSRFSATVKILHFAHLFELSTASLDTQPDKLISLQCVEPGHCRSSSWKKMGDPWHF